MSNTLFKTGKDSKTVQIRLVEWELYKSNRAIKQGTWFRLPCDILEDVRIQSLNPKEILLYFRIISDCSRKQEGCTTVNPRMILHSCRIAYSTLHRAIKNLEGLGLIEIIRHNRTELNRTELNSTSGKPKSAKKRKAKTSSVPKKYQDKMDEFDTRLASAWYANAKSLSPNVKFNEEEFSKAICHIRHEWSIEKDEFERLMNWIHGHTRFWRANAKSPVSLLNASPSSPGEKKIDVVLVQFRQETNRENQMSHEEQKKRKEIDDFLKDFTSGSDDEETK